MASPFLFLKGNHSKWEGGAAAFPSNRNGFLL
jgi:hypothetical protein